jgi:hypothetical protein
MSTSGAEQLRRSGGQTQRPLWFISGVSGCGKTTFIRNYYAGGFYKKLSLEGVPRPCRHIIDFNDVSHRPGTTRYNLHNYNKIHLIEYNILKPFHVNRLPMDHDDPYGNDPVWRFFVSKFKTRLRVVVFVLEYNELMRRVRVKYEGRSRLKLLRGCYATKDAVVKLYERWLAELDRQNISYDMIYCSKCFGKIKDIRKAIVKGCHAGKNKKNCKPSRR